MMFNAIILKHWFSYAGAAALDPKANGKISLIAFIFIISTNGLGSAIGMGATLMFGAGIFNFISFLSSSTVLHDDLVINIRSTFCVVILYNETNKTYLHVQNMLLSSCKHLFLLRNKFDSARCR